MSKQARIIELLEAGLKSKEIAINVGTSRKYVRKIATISKLGVQREKKINTPKAKRKEFEALVAMVNSDPFILARRYRESVNF